MNRAYMKYLEDYQTLGEGALGVAFKSAVNNHTGLSVNNFPIVSPAVWRCETGKSKVLNSAEKSGFERTFGRLSGEPVKIPSGQLDEKTFDRLIGTVDQRNPQIKTIQGNLHHRLDQNRVKAATQNPAYDSWQSQKSAGASAKAFVAGLSTSPAVLQPKNEFELKAPVPEAPGLVSGHNPAYQKYLDNYAKQGEGAFITSLSESIDQNTKINHNLAGITEGVFNGAKFGAVKTMAGQTRGDMEQVLTKLNGSPVSLPKGQLDEKTFNRLIGSADSRNPSVAAIENKHALLTESFPKNVEHNPHFKAWETSKTASDFVALKIDENKKAVAAAEAEKLPPGIEPPPMVANGKLELGKSDKVVANVNGLKIYENAPNVTIAGPAVVEAQKVVAAANDPHSEYKDLGKPLGAQPEKAVAFTPLIRRTAFDTGTVAVLPKPPVPDVQKFDSPFKEPAVAKGNEPVNTPAMANVNAPAAPNVVSPAIAKVNSPAEEAGTSREQTRPGETPTRLEAPQSHSQPVAPNVPQEVSPTVERSAPVSVPQARPAQEQMTVAKNLLPKGFKGARSLNVRERTADEERQLAAKQQSSPQQFRSLGDVQKWCDKTRGVGVAPGKSGPQY